MAYNFKTTGDITFVDANYAGGYTNLGAAFGLSEASSFGNLDTAITGASYFVGSDYSLAGLLVENINKIENLVSAGGEANTASNQGTGQGLYKTKNVLDLEFYTLGAGSSKLSISSPASDIISLDVVEASIDHGSISGLGDDDHTQYMLATGSRDFSGVVVGVTPTLDSHLATKGYVDTVAEGLHPKAAVRVATAADLPAYTKTGTGVGAYLEADANGSINTGGIDGVTDLTVGDRILFKNAAAGAETADADNGVYEVTVVGDAGTPWKITRTTDFDGSPVSEVQGGDFMFVQEGTANADSGWVLITNGTITVDTTPLAFSQFSGAGMVTAGTGLTKTGNTINVGSGTIESRGGIDFQANDLAVAVDNTTLEISSNQVVIKTWTLDDAYTSGANANVGVDSYDVDFQLAGTSYAFKVTSTNDVVSFTGDGSGNIDGVINVDTLDIDGTTSVNIDSAGVLELNSSAGAIGIGTDDVDQNINIGTQGERTVSIATGAFTSEVIIGNTTGSTTVSIDVPSGGFDINGTTGVSGIIDDDTMATASAVTLATSESIKAYVDNHISVETLQGAYEAGNTIAATSAEGALAFSVADGQNIAVLTLTQSDTDTKGLILSTASSAATISLEGAGTRSIVSDTGDLTLSTTTSGNVNVTSAAKTIFTNNGNAAVTISTEGAVGFGFDPTGGPGVGPGTVMIGDPTSTSAAAYSLTMADKSTSAGNISMWLDSGNFEINNVPGSGAKNIDVYNGAGTPAQIFRFDSSGHINAVDGVALTPTYSFLNAVTSGMYWDNAASELTFSVGNSDKLRIGNAGVYFANVGTGGFSVDVAQAISFNTGTTIQLDAAAASNFTVAGADLTLSTTTSGDIYLTSADDIFFNADGYVFGADALATWNDALVISSGALAADGDSQGAVAHLRAHTTTGTTTDYLTPDAAGTLSLAVNKAYSCKCTVVAKQSGGTAVAGWDVTFLVLGGATTGGAPTLVSGSTNVNKFGEQGNADDWDVTVTAATEAGTGGELRITCNGTADENIEWTGTLITSEALVASA